MKYIGQVRKRIEEESLPTSVILELAQPLLAKNTPTAEHWEMIEMLLTRALLQLKDSASSDNAIKRILLTLIPAHYRYHRHNINPQLCEEILFEIARLRYQLSYTHNLDRLVTDLIPNKRKLHARLARTLGDVDLTAQALQFTLALRRQFLISFENFLKQLRVVIESLAPQLLSASEEIKQFCQNPDVKFAGPYEENGSKFENLLALYTQFRKIAQKHDMEQLFQSTINEQLEAELAVQTSCLVAQVALQHDSTAGLTTKIVKLNQGSLALRSWEAAALIALSDQAAEGRAAAAREVLCRGMALVAAIKDRWYETDTLCKMADSDAARDYLYEQLRAAVNHLEWLAARPCTKNADIRLSTDLQQTRKKWVQCLSSQEYKVDALSA